VTARCLCTSVLSTAVEEGETEVWEGGFIFVGDERSGGGWSSCHSVVHSSSSTEDQAVIDAHELSKVEELRSWASNWIVGEERSEEREEWLQRMNDAMEAKKLDMHSSYEYPGRASHFS
jgi:hypothetical protein